MDLNFFNNKRVLITGGNGFIGNAILRSLIGTQAKIYILDQIISGTLNEQTKNSNHIDFFKIDLTNYLSVKSIINKIKPDIIFHLAGDINRSYSLDLADKLIKRNINSTINVLNALAEVDFKSFVFASTCEVYGTENTTPLNEKMYPEPISLYSFTKLTAEYFCKYFSKKYNKTTAILRLFNVYGEQQNNNMFMPQLMQACHENKVFNMTKGEQTRDFVYVDDVVNAFLSAAQLNNGQCEIFNIGNGVATKIRTLAELIISLYNCRDILNIGAIPYSDNEIWNSKADITKAKKLLNWEPSYTLESGIQKMIAYNNSLT